MLFATSRAVASNSAAGTTRFPNPRRQASCASIRRPVKTRSRATPTQHHHLHSLIRRHAGQAILQLSTQRHRQGIPLVHSIEKDENDLALLFHLQMLVETRGLHLLVFSQVAGKR